MKIYLAGGNGKNQLMAKLVERERERDGGAPPRGLNENIPCRERPVDMGNARNSRGWYG